MLENGTDVLLSLMKRVDALCVYHVMGVFGQTPCGLGRAAVSNENHLLKSVVWLFQVQNYDFLIKGRRFYSFFSPFTLHFRLLFPNFALSYDN